MNYFPFMHADFDLCWQSWKLILYTTYVNVCTRDTDTYLIGLIAVYLFV